MHLRSGRPLTPRTQTPTVSTMSSTESTANATQTAPVINNTDPKIPKFNGKDEGLEIESFLIIFERLFTHLTDDQKLTKVVAFLEGDAANTYAIDVLSNSTISWAEAKNKLIASYGHSNLPPMIAASRRRLIRTDTIKTYFDEKSKLLRRTALTEPDIADMLTEGLPDTYRSHFYGRRFQSTTDWLQTAQDIEADLNKRHPVP